MRTRAVALAFVAACTPHPDVVVICHNGNCAGASTEVDDTLPALDASLALTDDDGIPFVDGIEIDLSWLADESRCVFAHDLGPDLPDATAAAQRVSDHVASGRQLTRHGDTFYVMIELKPAVDKNGRRHRPDELAAHAECALAATTEIRTAATGAGHNVRFLLESFEPDLLAALAARGLEADTQLSAAFEFPTLLGAPHALADFDLTTLGVVDVHPEFTSSEDFATYRALGLDVALWVDLVTPQLFATISQVEPAYVDTNEVRLVSAWLDR